MVLGTERPSPDRMTGSPHFFELSGEHPTLPRAEVLSCVRAETGPVDEMTHGPGYVVCRLRETSLENICSRLGLCHRAGGYLGQCAPDEIERFCPGLSLPEGTVAVRARRFEGNHVGLSAAEVSRRVADVVTRGRKVDLESPEVELRVLITDRLHFYLSECVVDRGQFERRKVGLRPFFSPVSLHPKFARALINLTGVPTGGSLLDPFCGTGGILIEASLMGLRALGSDISADMVEGCRVNLEHFGARSERLEVVDVGDIADVFDHVDAVATDPPYGRSATTMREGLISLYARSLASMAEVIKEGGGAGIVFPHPCPVGVEGLAFVESHEQRVHKSLSRHYCVFTRR